MRWDGTERGGFTSGDPWLPMGHDVAEPNVTRLRADPQSLLSLYRRLIQLRRAEPVLVAGEYAPMRSRNDVLLYKRADGGDELLVALNITHEPRKLPWEGKGTLMLSSHLDRDPQRIADPVLLRPDEGIIVKLHR